MASKFSSLDFLIVPFYVCKSLFYQVKLRSTADSHPPLMLGHSGLAQLALVVYRSNKFIRSLFQLVHFPLHARIGTSFRKICIIHHSDLKHIDAFREPSARRSCLAFPATPFELPGEADQVQSHLERFLRGELPCPDAIRIFSIRRLSRTASLISSGMVRSPLSNHMARV